MRLPSVKTLCSAFPGLTAADAKLLRAILRGDLSPCHYPDRFPRTIAWLRSCYNPPSRAEISMAAADEILDCHGVEALFSDGAVWPWLEFVNTGDLYNATLCRYDGRYIVASPGDILERDKRGAE